MDSVPKRQARGSLKVADLPRFSGMDDLPRQQSSGTFVARSLIDISALDSRIQEQIAKYGSIKDFHVVLWRNESDAAGCNWNARIGRFQGNGSSDSSWWDVVPQMRERFNLR
jgi:hypothetical protein